ncbi:MAG: diguanylate cyclase [Clostridiales bacterium]|nr:diguanylate cyclase [Clostridiales bacterium]
MDNQAHGDAHLKHPAARGKIAGRFRRANIAIFSLAVLIMLASMLFVFSGIIREVSSDYTERYATSSANALSVHLEKEIGLLSKAAHSNAVIDWLSDESGADKQALAYQELSGVVRELYSNNLYIGASQSQHEYSVAEGSSREDMRLVAELTRGNEDDAWFYACIAADDDYLLSVDQDHIMQKKRIWLDYKVVKDSAPLGVICTGLDFSHIVQELFSKAGGLHMRGFIVDEDGAIFIDSALWDDEGFLNHDFESRIEDVFADQALLDAIEYRLSEPSRGDASTPHVVSLDAGRYRYASVTPIRFTGWHAVILYDSTSSFSMSRFLPAFTVILLILIAFALATSAISFGLIFKPLSLLVGSMVKLKENHEEHIYGIERDDEFGNLSNTIIDLFAKANYDALTGIYNRRFMESNLQQVIEFLSRSNGVLSLLIVDVDHFKKFNDTYGHHEGDKCLRAVAQAMAGSLTRSNDFVARYGGEEFVAVLPNTDETGVRLIASKILENVRQLNIPHEKNSAAECVTVSVGATSGTVDYSHKWTDYIQCADGALYESKRSGRNRSNYRDFSPVE